MQKRPSLISNDLMSISNQTNQPKPSRSSGNNVNFPANNTTPPDNCEDKHSTSNYSKSRRSASVTHQNLFNIDRRHFFTVSEQSFDQKMPPRKSCTLVANKSSRSSLSSSAGQRDSDYGYYQPENKQSARNQAMVPSDTRRHQHEKFTINDYILSSDSSEDRESSSPENINCHSCVEPGLQATVQNRRATVGWPPVVYNQPDRSSHNNMNHFIHGDDLPYRKSSVGNRRYSAMASPLLPVSFEETPRYNYHDQKLIDCRSGGNQRRIVGAQAYSMYDKQRLGMDKFCAEGERLDV